jgi:hypothetical protein
MVQASLAVALLIAAVGARWLDEPDRSASLAAPAQLMASVMRAWPGVPAQDAVVVAG